MKTMKTDLNTSAATTLRDQIDQLYLLALEFKYYEAAGWLAEQVLKDAQRINYAHQAQDPLNH
jgi:hypothetical protein